MGQHYNGWAHKQVGRQASAYYLPELAESEMTYPEFVGSLLALNPMHLDNSDIDAMRKALPEGDGYESETPPEERFESARKAVNAIRHALPDDVELLDACDKADEYIAEEIRSAGDGWRESSGRSSWAASESGVSSTVAPLSSGGRDPFDDVADGH